MKKFIIILIVLFIVFSGCHVYEQKVEIENAAVSDALVLKKNSAQENIHKLTIWVRGDLDGKASLSLMLDGKIYNATELSGKFDLKMYSGDWYSDSAELLYKPTGVKSGNVKLIYTFFD